AFVVGMILTWGLERFREPVSIIAGPPVSGPAQQGAGPKRETEPGSKSTAREGQQQNGDFELAKVELAVTQPSSEVPDARRWRWWGRTVLLVALALLFGVAALARRERRIVQDSPAFASALRCVKPLLSSINATPRAIKRYQNRMRYLAARLRPAEYEPD